MTQTQSRASRLARSPVFWLTMLLGVVLLGCGIFQITVHYAPYGYVRDVSTNEQEARQQLVQAAVEYLGCNEDDGSYKAIIDLYNTQDPLPADYQVQYADQWCATFGSVAAMQCGMTRIIPTECSCQRQIELFNGLGCWEEDDAYVPLPGDYIFYHTGHRGSGDCTHWSNHVGIVVGVWGSYIKVIEGNCYEAVQYRFIPLDHESIRGFGLPDYRGVVE